jgi:two-component system sensor histidine kinase NreB
MRYLKEAVVESRRLVNGLRSLALDDLGLAGALEQLLDHQKEQGGWKEVEFVHNVANRRYDRSLETTVYRVTQEAVTNARKHAQTHRLRVYLWEQEESEEGYGALTLEVRDFGLGFVPALRSEDLKSVGLHGMRERVELLGGNYSLESAPGQGTVVRAIFPLLEMDSDLGEEGKR